MGYKISQEEQSGRIDNTKAEVAMMGIEGQAGSLSLIEESSLCFSKALTDLPFCTGSLSTLCRHFLPYRTHN